MIDTVRIFKEVENSIQYLHYIREKLSSSIIKEKSNGELEVVGKYKNLIVKMSESRIVISGSIHVFAKGDNIKLLTITEIHDSFVGIGNYLEIDIWNFKVTRVDISINILSNIGVGEIKQSLNIPKHMKMLCYQDGVIYGNSIKQLVFYDKHKESKLKNRDVPKAFDTKKFVRVEFRLMKASSINSIFKLKSTTLEDVLNNYETLFQYFHSHVNGLCWSKNSQDHNNIFFESLDLKLLLLKQGLENLGGLQAGYELLEAAKPLYKNMYPNRYSNDRKLLERLNDLNTTKSFTKSVEEFKNMCELAFIYANIMENSCVSK